MKENTRNKSASAGMGMLLAISLAHFFNDMFQSVLSAVYPVIKDNLMLDFKQIGFIALVYQVCASVFQPIFGIVFDKYPSSKYLTIGTLSTITGLIILANSNSLPAVLLSVIFIGLGSSVNHPEASKLTHYASGGKYGLAQSIFQVGGNLGSALGPLFAALIVAPYGQKYVMVFAGIGIISILTKIPITRWYKRLLQNPLPVREKKVMANGIKLSENKIYFSLFILLVLIFSKYVYTASLTNFYTFYLIEKFKVTTQESQYLLFVFLFASALGTLAGGPIGDRFGRKYVIWFSILGAAPFALLLPYANLLWTIILSFIIGLVLSSAFSAILVFAQELMPSKLSLISGFFYGIAFGIAGIAAAVLGNLAENRGIEYVYHFCAFMPLLGFVAIFLPNVKPSKKE